MMVPGLAGWPWRASATVAPPKGRAAGADTARPLRHTPAARGRPAQPVSDCRIVARVDEQPAPDPVDRDVPGHGVAVGPVVVGDGAVLPPDLADGDGELL